MAEEALSRGHEVAVFAGEHQGNHNGVTVTHHAQILMASWDLIIVHGGDVHVQNFVLQHAALIPSPMLYLLILPSHSDVCVKALHDCAYLGWSTPDDINHIGQYGQTAKARRVRHGIKHQASLGQLGFKAQYGISQRMFLSCGGYWPNKKMRELAEVFTRAELPDTVLVTTGYDNRMNLMPTASSCVMPLMIDSKQQVLSAIAEADCYLLHSNQEGFGLVILESMLNGTPWIARHVAGAAMLNRYGQTYHTDSQLIDQLRHFDPRNFDLTAAKNHVLANHTIASTLDDIEAVISSS